MSVFGEALLGRSKGMFWALAPFLLGGMAVVTFPMAYEDGFHAVAVLACDLAGVFLLLSLWPYHELPGVRRMLMGTVAVAFTYYVVDAWFPGLFPRKGERSNAGMASAGFLIVGIPCWKYALLGRFTLFPPPIAIDENEPLLLDAYAEARASLPRLRSAYQECPERTFVRFAFRTSEDETEHLWGKLQRLTEETAEVEVVTQPVTHDEPLESHTFPIAELEDWEAEHTDGTVEGGFATRAMVAVARREGQPVPREVEKRLARYRAAA